MTFPIVLLAFQRTIIIKRAQPGSYIDHEFISGGTIQGSLLGSVQPATSKDLRSQPYGEDFISGLKVYTKDSVSLTDILEDNSSEYRVIGIVPWQHHGYIKVIAGLIT